MSVEHAEPSGSKVATKTGKDESSIGWVVQNQEGPGILGLELSLVNERLRDLATDNVIPRPERERLQAFYTHERSKLQWRLNVLGKIEKVKTTESALEEAEKALDCIRSQTGGPGEDEIRYADSRRSLAHASLIQARSELQAASSALERFCEDETGREEQASAASRWESSRTWKAITPEELQPAIEALRHTFEHYGCWQSRESTMRLCYAALHPASPKDSGKGNFQDLDSYERFLVELLGPQVERRLLGSDQPAPVIFKSYIDVLETALKVVLRGGFKEMLEIAKAWAETLGTHPVEWTKRQLQILISGQKSLIRLWIKEVCDATDFSKTAFDDCLFGGSWRAPRFIHMKPAGNTPYDEAGPWGREELERSEQLLEARATRLTEFLRIELEEVARQAHVAFVKEDGSPLRHLWPKDSRRAASSNPSTPAIVGTQASHVWRNLHDAFIFLAEEEQRLAPQNTSDRWLRAHVHYKNSSAACGEWHLSGGVNERFRERFEVEATRAGIALGSTLAGEVRDIWLHHVFSELLEHGSKLLFAASQEGGIILRASEASAIYCARLEKDALIAGMKHAAPNSSQLSTIGAATNPPAGEGLTQTAPPNQTLLEAIVRKVENPQAYTALSTPEAALYYQVRPRTIHRWIAEGKLRRAGRRGFVAIESIQNWDKRRSRKPRST